MKILAIMLAWGRYGPQPDPGPGRLGMVCFFVGVFAIIGIWWFANRKKFRKEFDQMNEDSVKQNEPPKGDGKPWKCAKCGEILESQFRRCWKCGTERKDDNPMPQAPDKSSCTP